MKTQQKIKIMVAVISCLCAVFIILPSVFAGESHRNHLLGSADDSGILLAKKEGASPEKETPTYEKLMKMAMDQFFAVVESIANDKTLTKAQQLKKIYEFQDAVRWGPENKHSFFTMDDQGKILKEIYQPDFIGKDMSNWSDPNGIKAYTLMLKIIREKGEGFTHYLYPRFDGKFPTPCVAFVRLFKPYNLIWGTRTWNEDVEAFEDLIKAKLPITLGNPPEPPKKQELKPASPTS